MAAWIGGYQRPKALVINAALTAGMTLGITLAANALTGIHTGLAEPIITRFLAGLLGAVIANRLVRETESSRDGSGNAL